MSELVWIIRMLRHGDVTFAIQDAPPVRPETQRSPTPYVRVTAKGQTWQQPIMRSVNAEQSTPEQIAEAIECAMKKLDEAQ